MHKRRKIFFAILSIIVSFLFLIQNTIPIYAREESRQARRVVAKEKLGKGKAAMDITLVRLAPGKVAAVVEVPLKSDAKIDDIYLKSPSGKKYKAKSQRSIPASQLEDYLGTVSLIKNKLLKFCGALKSFVMPEAHATCGECGVEAEGGGEPSGSESRADREAQAAFFGLLKRAGQIGGLWLTVCIFEIEEEPGEWGIVVIYYEKGKRNRINIAVLVSAWEGIVVASKPEEEEEKIPETTEEEELPEEEEELSEEEEEEALPEEEEEEEEEETAEGGKGTVVRYPKGKPPKEEKEEVPLSVPLIPEKLGELPCCQYVGSSVTYPLTSDPLLKPKEQEAYNSPAVGAYNVLLHDKSFIEQTIDLFVKSAGLDFIFMRTYRSNVTTRNGGLIGHKWDFNLNKRLLPLGGQLIPDYAMKVESPGTWGDVEYRNGTGRVDRMRFKHAEERMVRNFKKRFLAHVTTYEGAPGIFAELQRYAVRPGWPCPFSNHPNFEGRLFYVLRFKKGYLEVFNCRGQIIYAIDPNENTVTFKYREPINPLTQCPTLYEVIDTAGRTYSIEHVDIDEGKVFTNYHNRVVRGKLPIKRIKAVVDPEGRRTEFEYEGGDSRPVLERSVDTLDGRRFENSYHYTGDNLLQSVTFPNESSPYIVNTYKKESVSSQTLGRVGSVSRTAGYEGGEYKIQGDKVIDPSGNKSEYNLTSINGHSVIKSFTQQTEGGSATTEFEYNDDHQITKIVYPNGNETTYEYDTQNEPIVPPIGDVLDWEEKTMTYENNLSKGNLLKAIYDAKGIKHEIDHSSIRVVYEYEPRFNACTLIEGPGPQREERTYNHGWYASPGQNGNPLTVKFARSGAEGGKVRQAREYDNKGFMTTLVNAVGETTSYTYSNEGYLKSITSPTGTSSFERDGRGNMTGFTDERGVVYRYRVNQRDLVESERQDADSYDNTIEYRYDDIGNVVRKRVLVKDNVPRGASRHARRYTHGRSGWLTTHYEYNALNHITNERQEAEGSQSYEVLYGYDQNQNLIRIRMPEGNEIVREFTPRGLLKSESRAGTTIRHHYDKNGNHIKTIDGRNQATEYIYDGFDRHYKTIGADGTEILNLLRPDGAIKETKITGKNHAGRKVLLSHTETQTDEFKRVIGTVEHVLDQNGNNIHDYFVTYTRDGIGRVVGIQYRPGYSMNIGYEQGRKRRVTDSLGNETIYSWDGNYLSSVTSNETGRRYTIRRGDSEPRSANQASSYTNTFTYDSLGRLVATSTPDGGAARYIYNSLDQIRVESLPGGVIHSHEYDGLGREITFTQFANIRDGRKITRTTYDNNSREIETSISGGGADIVKRFTYDEADRVRTVSSGNKTYTYQYDGNGNVIRETLPNGIVISREYDELNRLITTNPRYSYGPRQGGSYVDNFRYDGLGRLVFAERLYASSGGIRVRNSMEYDSHAHLLRNTQDINGNTYTFNYTYNPNGTRDSMIYPSLPGFGSVRLNYRHDELGRLHSISSAGDFDVRMDYFDRTRPSAAVTNSTKHVLYDYYPSGLLRNHMIFSALERAMLYNASYAYDAQGQFNEQGTHKRPLHILEATNTAYTRWGAIDRVHTGATINKPAIDEQIVESVDRYNSFEGGRLASSINYFVRYRDYPGTLWGRNMDATATVSNARFRYDSTGENIERVTFEHYEAPTRLRRNRVESLAQGRGADPLWRHIQDITHDENGNIIEDRRYNYTVDYKDIITYANDKFQTTRDHREYMSYVYDYLNRPVLIVWGPDHPDIDRLHKHRRFLYDGPNMVADLESDRQGRAVRTNIRYITNPDSVEVYQMDVREPNGNFGRYYPFFGKDESLALLLKNLDDIKEIELKFDSEVHRWARLRPFTKGEGVEIPIAARGFYLDPFTGHFLGYAGHGIVPDVRRDFDKEWRDLVEYNAANFAELNNALQKEALMLMGFEFLPFLLASPWVIVAATGDVVIEMGIAAVLDQNYGWDDALLAFQTGVVFAAFGSQIKALERLRPASFKSYAKSFSPKSLRHVSKKKTIEAGGEESFDLLGDISKKKKGDFSILHPDAAKRMDVWNALKSAGREELVRREMEKLLVKYANWGNEFARDLLYDLDDGAVKLFFTPESSVNGFFGGGKILYVNPFIQKTLSNRDILELTSTMLHEYVHMKGYNEIRAWFEQSLFLVIHGHHIARPSVRRELIGRAARFAKSLRQGGKEAAISGIRDQIMKIKGYVRNYKVDPFRKVLDLSPMAFGNKQKIKDLFLGKSPVYEAAFGSRRYFD